MEALRFQVVGEAFKKKPLDVKTPSERPYEYFGKKVFNREKMYKYLPKDVYEKMIDVMDNGARLDRAVADAVAAGFEAFLAVFSPDDFGDIEWVMFFIAVFHEEPALC